MPRLISRCVLEIAGVEHQPGDVIEVDEDNAVRLLRQNAAVPAPKAPPKAPAKKKKPAKEDAPSE